jgi:hypothetical protein
MTTNIWRLSISYFICLLCCLILYLPQTAYADKDSWHDPDYGFTKIDTALIYDIDLSQIALDNTALQKTLSHDYLAAAQRTKCTILDQDKVERRMSLSLGQDVGNLLQHDPDAGQALFGQHLSEFADIYIKASLDTYKLIWYHHEARTEWEPKTYDDTVYDKDGHPHTITRHEIVPVYHPAYDSADADVRLSFHVYDAKTHKEIATRTEERVRSNCDNSDLKGVYGRICSAYFNDLNKLMKK